MATYNYLWLVNRVCHKLNEVPLTASNFTSAQGFYLDVQESVNAAIRDICQDEDDEWPFLWTSTNLTTVIGTNFYNVPVGAMKLDWDSFYIQRPIVTFTTPITQVGGTATATLPTAYQGQIITGDTVVIQGSHNATYDGTYAVTAPNLTTFTFSVPTTTVSPDTSITTQFVSPVSTLKLTPIDADAYREEGYLNTDGEAYAPGMYGVPRIVVRRKDNNILISPKPDRIYTIPFDYYSWPTDLTNATDVPVIPESFKEVIVKRATTYAYMFRDNIEENQSQTKEFQDSLNSMRRILIPQQYFMRIDQSVSGGTYNGVFK